MCPHVGIIIVNWNGKADTIACLESLTQSKWENQSVIIVDNGSCDDSVAVFKTRFPYAQLICSDCNLGFSGGNNLGIRFALEQNYEYLFLLNNDTVIEPETVTKLVEAAQANPDYGLLTSVIHIFSCPEQVWFSGAKLDLKHGIAEHNNTHIPDRTASPFQIPWASGCALLVRADAMRQLQGFDERFFLNWEDVDLSLRARAAGQKIAIVPASRIYHKVSSSISKVPSAGLYYYVRNNLLLIRLHGGRKRYGTYIYVIARQMFFALRAIKQRQPNAWTFLTVSIRAISDHLRRRYGAVVTFDKTV